MTLQIYENIVLDCRHRLFGYAVRMVRDRELAADLCQDVLVRLWHHRDSVEADRALPWLLRVMRNACIDALRRKQVEYGLFDAEAEASLQPDQGKSPDRQAGSELLRTHLERALDQLSEPYRSIVILREVEDFRYDEIAGALNLPLTTVKVYLHRARKRLRTIIEKELNGELV